ncbi:MAG: hypothetical protein M1819_004732 [Sarea resinae]|nr:MAG: hypothetical protein M1819_004732 [Sarea resinae]
MDGEWQSLLNSDEDSHSLSSGGGGNGSRHGSSIINSNGSDVAPSLLSYLSHLDPALEAGHASTCMVPSPEINSLYHADATNASFPPTPMPSISFATPDSFMWSDLLTNDEGQSSSSSDLHPSQHSGRIHFHRSDDNDNNRDHRSLQTPPDDDDCGKDVPWDCGLGSAGSSFPHASNTPSRTASGEYGMVCNDNTNTNSKGDCGISETLGKLSRLQQDLVQFARPPSEDSDSSGTPTSNGQERRRGQGGRQRACPPDPVKAILKPGQELLDIVRELLSKCHQDENGYSVPSRTPFAQQTVLLAVLTPLSLLLSIYSQLLREIAAAMTQHESGHSINSSSRGATGTDPSRPFLETMPPSSTELRTHHRGQQQQQQQKQKQHQRDSRTLIPNNLNLTLGEMKLDQPLQLILIATIINRHCIYLEHALHVYHIRHAQCSASHGISERLFLTVGSEMKGTLKVLMSEARDLL